MIRDPGAELVDVVDQNGQVVGIVTRREMRARQLPHRCIYILVFDRTGKLFIHLRTPTKDVYPSRWDAAVGGVLSAGESFEVGAAREAREELGVDVDLELLFPFPYADDRTRVHAMVYRAVHEGPFQLQPEEVVRGEFVGIPEVFERTRIQPFCPDGLAALEEYCRVCLR